MANVNVLVGWHKWTFNETERENPARQWNVLSSAYENNQSGKTPSHTSHPLVVIKIKFASLFKFQRRLFSKFLYHSNYYLTPFIGSPENKNIWFNCKNALSNYVSHVVDLGAEWTDLCCVKMFLHFQLLLLLLLHSGCPLNHVVTLSEIVLLLMGNF